MDTARKLRLLKLIEEEGIHYVGNWEELKFLIAPFVATQAEEQRLFYEIFEEFQADCKEVKPSPSPEKKPWWEKVQIPLIATAALLVLMLLLFFLFRPQPQPPLPLKTSRVSKFVLEGREMTVKNLSPRPDSLGFEWRLYDKNARLLFRSEDVDFRWQVENYRGALELVLKAPAKAGITYDRDSVSSFFIVVCKEGPQLESRSLVPSPSTLLFEDSLYRFAIDPGSANQVKWIFDGRDTLEGARVSYQVNKSEGQLDVEINLIDSEDCFNGQKFTYSISRGKPFLKLMALRELEPEIRHELSLLYWLLFVLPLLALPWLLWRWWKETRAKTEAKSSPQLEEAYAVLDSPPYFIPYRSQEEHISVPRDFYRMGEVLRRRQEDLGKEFDSEASIQATLAAGGFPAFRERSLSRPTDYLMFIRRRQEGNQQEQLLIRLANFLLDRDAPVKVFYHNGSFERFWEAGGKETYGLDEVYREHSRHRLILLGDAHGLVNPYDSRKPSLLKGKLKGLLKWERRLVLTLEAPADWSWQEVLLHRHFLLYPATTAAMLEALEALDKDEEYLPGDFDLHQRQLQKAHPQPSARYRQWTNLEDVRAYFERDRKTGFKGDSEAFRWLCGIAVAAAPDWSLSIALGQALGIEVSHDRLLMLSRIPWLATNSPKHELRLDLLRHLSPEDTRIAREAVLAELEVEEVMEKVQSSFAKMQWTSDRAVQHFALDPRNPLHKQHISELKEMGLLSGEQEEELDFVVREQADGSGLPPKAKLSLQDWLETPQRPKIWTGNLMLALALILLGLGGMTYGWWYNAQVHQGPANHPFQRNVSESSTAIALHNQAIRLSQQRDSLKLWSAWKSQEEKVDSAIRLLASAHAAAEDRLKPLIDSSYFGVIFNDRFTEFNFFLEDSLDYDSIGFLNQTFYPKSEEVFQDLAGRQYLAITHFAGLGQWYGYKEKGGEEQLDSARIAYGRLMAYSQDSFFDSISEEMPVNLQTLLDTGRAADSPEIGDTSVFQVITLYDSLDHEIRFRANSDQVALRRILSISNGVSRLNPEAKEIPDSSGKAVIFVLPVGAFTAKEGNFAFDFEFRDREGKRVKLSKKVFIKDPEIPLPKMVRIPGGSFMMGSDGGYRSERPIQEVKLSTFYLAETETTNEEFCAFLNVKGNQQEGGSNWINIKDIGVKIKEKDGGFVVEEGYGRHPVVQVTWYGARAYAKWLSELSGDSYGLPSEAQWEYAAGGGDSKRTIFAGTDSISELKKYANYRSSGPKTVKSLLPNSLGLYDMSGNVWEWCEDTWHDDYEGVPTDGRAWIGENKDLRVVRGGSWNGSRDRCRVSFRYYGSPFIDNVDRGFRLFRYPAR